MFLITGSQGFIGSHLMKEFPNAIGIDKTDRKKEQRWERIDLLDKDALFWFMNMARPDYVFHQAAVPSVPDSFKDPMRSYINNVNASINLIDVCLKVGVKKLIFASSSSVKGPSPYGHSKLMIEELLPKSGLNFTVLRYFNVFGYGQRENVMGIMYRNVKANHPVVINGNGLIARDFTYIENVIKANKKALGSAYDRQVLEVGTGKPHTLFDLYHAIKDAINPFHRDIIIGPERPGDIKLSCAKTFLAEQEIIPFKDGLKLWLEAEQRGLE